MSIHPAAPKHCEGGLVAPKFLNAGGCPSVLKIQNRESPIANLEVVANYGFLNNVLNWRLLFDKEGWLNSVKR